MRRTTAAYPQASVVSASSSQSLLSRRLRQIHAKARSSAHLLRTTLRCAAGRARLSVRDGTGQPINCHPPEPGAHRAA